MTNDAENWIDLGEEENETIQIDEYDLTSSPNDFNVKTIVDFIESGAVQIPDFQRNYVWDIKQASRLVESLIIGLPVPQVFLYEEGRNSFLVVDGQQRLMSIFYFTKGRFPRPEKRSELRRIVIQENSLPESILWNDEFFQPFNLRLPEISAGVANKFTGLNYQTLESYQTQFDLRTIRNVIVKQLRPDRGDSSMYEMFNRLNTGGVPLFPQEIRSSLFHSRFYNELFALNLLPAWRSLLNQSEADLHMRDVEILLRGIAMWKKGTEYKPSLVKFLNTYSKQARTYSDDEIEAIKSRVILFLGAIEPVPKEHFLTQRKRFGVSLFESVFSAVCTKLETDPDWRVDPDAIKKLSETPQFVTYSLEKTTSVVHVEGRLRLAKEILLEGN